MEEGRIIIKPYDSKSPSYFEKEKNFLLKELGDKFEINHIGSTAVPGLGGKNVIDIQLLVPTKKVAFKIVKKLEDIGYFYNRKGGDRFRLFFNRNRHYDKKVHIHLHVMWKTSNKYKNHLIFRDYLRRHPEEAKRYFSLKKRWAKIAGEDREKFTDLKTEYIKEVLKKAVG